MMLFPVLLPFSSIILYAPVSPIGLFLDAVLPFEISFHLLYYYQEKYVHKRLSKLFIYLIYLSIQPWQDFCDNLNHIFLLRRRTKNFGFIEIRSLQPFYYILCFVGLSTFLSAKRMHCLIRCVWREPQKMIASNFPQIVLV